LSGFRGGAARLDAALIMRQPWIHSASVDSTFILAPAVVATFVAMAINASGHATAAVSLWPWAVLVIGIDVAHVYSTVFRTYMDRTARQELSGWLIATPLAAWVVGVLIYQTSVRAFWSVLAYTAVFHFVRQQFGFLMLYSRSGPWARRLDVFTIYSATLFPLLYWHTHLPRPFVWFMDGDFLSLPGWVWSIAWPFYAATLFAYVIKELWLIARNRTINVPGNALVLGTAASWYVGIVVASGDLVFTLTNVVAHGIPYVALTCIFARRRDQRRGEPRSLFAPRLLPIALGLLVAFAFVEEGLWDGLVWREHAALFPGFHWLPQIQTSTALSLLIPLLCVPQITHYVIDGVIWRMHAHPEWRRTLFWKGEVAT